MAAYDLRNITSFLATRLSRREKQGAQLLFDFAALTGAATFAFFVTRGRGHGFDVSEIAYIIAAPLIAVPIFIRLGLYRAVLRYLPDRAFLTIFQAVVLATLLWTVLAFFTEGFGAFGIPRSVPFLYAVSGFVLIASSRFLAKWMLYSAVDSQKRRRTLIYGAGRAGTQLAAVLGTGSQAKLLGFIDDDRDLQGRDVAGLRVYPPQQLENLVRNLGIEEVILSIPSATGARKLSIGSTLAQLPVRVRVLPAVSDFAAGHFSVNTLRDFDIGELIGRSMVPPDRDLIEEVVRGNRILITGAGGSIGTSLTKLVDAYGPRELVLVDSNEHSLYQVARSLPNANRVYPLHAILGSVTDRKFMERVFRREPIDAVFHAAAYKHVDLVEQNVREAIRNNIIGTQVTTEVAFKNGVKRLVFISTDKAVNPTSVMGATKRIGELIIRKHAENAAGTQTGQSFLSVRFGNVIGSSGSVVPLFKEQIENGGPVTVTDRDVTRYFMAASEAVELIVQAAAMSRGGETFLLDMGEPISIWELARNMIGLAGMRVRDEENPDGDVEIKIIGLRPGEKMHEELLYNADSTSTTAHPKIMKAKRPMEVRNKIDGILATLMKGVDELEEAALRDLLLTLTDEFNRAHYPSQVIELSTKAGFGAARAGKKPENRTA